jgi:hypothetical protein
MTQAHSHPGFLIVSGGCETESLSALARGSVIAVLVLVVQHLLAAGYALPFRNLGEKIVVDDDFLPSGIAVEYEAIHSDFLVALVID